jgi:hypothetical protein
MFKLSSDPAFIAKVGDVVSFYMSPPNQPLVLWVDEKPQIQAVERMTHDYERYGTTDPFAALDVKAGAR